MFEKVAVHSLFDVNSAVLNFRNAVNYVHYQMKTVEFVWDYYIKRCARGVFFFVAANLQIMVLCLAIS